MIITDTNLCAIMKGMMSKRLMIAGLVFTGGLAGCAKTEEVVPPVSTLETSLQPTGVPTQNPWPTAGLTSGQPSPTGTAVDHGTEYATTAAMTTQPQTGVDIKVLMMVFLLVWVGLWLVFSAKQGNIRGKAHAKKR